MTLVTTSEHLIVPYNTRPFRSMIKAREEKLNATCFRTKTPIKTDQTNQIYYKLSKNFFL